jgi:hypothetical protein
MTNYSGVGKKELLALVIWSAVHYAKILISKLTPNTGAPFATRRSPEIGKRKSRKRSA